MLSRKYSAYNFWPEKFTWHVIVQTFCFHIKFLHEIKHNIQHQYQSHGLRIFIFTYLISKNLNLFISTNFELRFIL